MQTLPHGVAARNVAPPRPSFFLPHDPRDCRGKPLAVDDLIRTTCSAFGGVVVAFSGPRVIFRVTSATDKLLLNESRAIELSKIRRVGGKTMGVVRV